METEQTAESTNGQDAEMKEESQSKDDKKVWGFALACISCVVNIITFYLLKRQEWTMENWHNSSVELQYSVLHLSSVRICLPHASSICIFLD